MPFQKTIARYAFSVAVVLLAFLFKQLLEPVTGVGAPFVLFFGAIVAASVRGGFGPGLCATILSIPLGAYVFGVQAGYPVQRAIAQASLFAADGLLVVHLSTLLTRARRAAESSEAQQRDLIDLAPDAVFLANLEGRFTDVNQSACRLLGYQRGELLGTTIADVVPPENVPRLTKTREALRIPGRIERGEWSLVHRSGRRIPVEVSANILPGGRWQIFARDISERKRVEDERQVFVALLENSSDFIGIADPSGRPVYLNPAGRRMVGLATDFSVGNTQLLDYYAPEERRLASDVILKSMIEQGRWTGETQFRHWRTEQPIPVSEEHFMIYDPKGERVLGMGTVTRDISEARRVAEEREKLLARERQARRQLEAANAELQESEERFRLTIDEAPIGMALVALDGRFVRVNAALCEIVGYTPEELLRLKFQDITHPEDLDSDLALANRLIRGEIPRYQLEKRYFRKNGSVVPVMLNASILRSPEGVPVYGIAQIEDISARKRVDEDQKFLAEVGAVLAASLDYEQTLTTIGELMVREFADLCILELIDQSGRLTRRRAVCAPRIQASLCAELEELRLDSGRPLGKAISSARRPLLIEQLTPERLETLGQSEEHLRLLRAIGPRSMIALPLLAHAQLQGTMLLISVTLSRKYEPADLRRAEALAERAALAIENGRLYQTALRATRLRDEVLGVVAHDLRNPLASITMMATSLKSGEGELEKRCEKAREVILRAAKRMNRLIENLLDVTLIEAGQLHLQCDRTSTTQLVRDSVEAQRPLASAASIELQSQLSDDLPDIWSDQHRILEVLDNLIGNAIKFTPAEGRILVGAAPKNSKVLFWVADTGAGISPEGLPRIFDRFWQERRRTRHGAGLGLPISRGIVEAHGGEIWAESKLGQGTIIFFTVPQWNPAKARHANAGVH